MAACTEWSRRLAKRTGAWAKPWLLSTTTLTAITSRLPRSAVIDISCSLLQPCVLHMAVYVASRIVHSSQFAEDVSGGFDDHAACADCDVSSGALLAMPWLQSSVQQSHDCQKHVE